MCVCLRLNLRQATLDLEGTLKECEGGAQFSNSAVVACHVVVGHRASKFVVLTKELALLQEFERTAHVVFLEVEDRKNVANLAKLLARLGELVWLGFRSRTSGLVVPN